MSSGVKVLIVEDEPNALMGLAELISGWGYRTETARDGLEGWEKVLAWNPAIVVTDLKMPRLDGLGLLAKLAAEGRCSARTSAVILLTAQGTIQTAVDAMKLGAYDFLLKPVDSTRLRNILANATRQRDTEIELEVARRRLRETGVLGSMVGNSKAMREIFALIEQSPPPTSPSSSPVKAAPARNSSPAPCTNSARASRGLSSPSIAPPFRNADRKRDLRPREGLFHRRGRTPRRLL